MVIDTTKRTRTCPKCKREFETEALFFEGRELFANRLAYCNACADAQDRERARGEIEASHAELKRQWDEICPLRFRDTDPAKLPSIQGFNQVIGWRFGQDGILAYGPSGRGKTRAIFCLLRRLHFKEHRSIIAIGAADFSIRCGKLFWENQSAAEAFIESLINVDVLSLDDLDKAKFTERTEAELFHVVDARTAHGRPILASLNSGGDDLADLMSDHRGIPIVRRLRDYCQPIQFK